jgi:type II secretory pathway pseudopilin PulG
MTPRAKLQLRHARTVAAGLSLVEIMVSLAISAMLLTAAAVAFNVSSDVVQENEEFFRASQAARVSLHQMLTNIRRGSVNLAASGSNAVRLVTAPEGTQTVGDDITYTYNSTTKTLMLVTNDNNSDADYPLASNVQSLSFDVEQGTDYNNAQCVSRVNIAIKVRVGTNEVTLSGSAAPRKNLRY